MVQQITATPVIPTQQRRRVGGVNLTVPVSVADTITGALAREVTTRFEAGLSASPALLDALLTMQNEVADAIDNLIQDAFGCMDLLSNAAPMALNSPMLLGSVTSGTLTVLLPGRVEAFDAAERAMTLVKASGAQVDLTDQGLIATIGQPRWVVLNQCSGEHLCHPTVALDGEATPGAVQITRVDFEV